MTRHDALPVLVVGLGTILLLVGWASGCQLGSEMPGVRTETVLPTLLTRVAHMTVHRPAGLTTPQLGAEEAVRIAMASGVRFYCLPDELLSLRCGSAQNPEVTTESLQLATLEFQSPQDIPTALPLAGWFGPLRGHEEMRQTERLCILLEQGQWAEVIVRHADGTLSCWKSNWPMGPP